MNRDDIIKMAKEAWLRRTGCVWTEPKCWSKAELVRFAELVAAAEREKVAQWMLREGYATGPGNNIEDLLQKLDWQIALNFNLGNAIKYIWRASLKGKEIEDLRKAKWYVEREIQRLTKENHEI